MATELARQMRHLAWRDRAEVLDAHFLRQAEAMLRPQTVDELIGRSPAPVWPHPATAEVDARTTRFADWSRGVVTAVLLDLDETPVIGVPEQAVTYMLAQHLSFARAAASWAAVEGRASLAAALGELPGYALVLLAASPNDTAERFLARDAFWTAVVKRT